MLLGYLSTDSKMRFLLTSNYLLLALKDSFTNATWNEVLAAFCYVFKENLDALKKAEKHELNG